DAGVLGNLVENYTMRLWGQTKEKGRSLFARFRTKTARAKHRTLDSILQGWALGKELQIKGASNAHLVMRQQVMQAVEDRKLLAEGAKAGIISAVRKEGFVNVEHPNFTRWQWIGKAEEGKTYSPTVFVSGDGNVFQRSPLYAEPILAKRLNRALGKSGLKGVWPFDWLSKWNAILKHTILTTSFFHHQAFLRSYTLASRGIDPGKGYAKGRDAIQNFTPEFKDLVRGGLTVGSVQDWEEVALHQKTLIGKILDRVPMAAGIKEKLVALRDRQTQWLFGGLGAQLKVQAALLEYRHLLKKYDAQLAAGTMARHDVAKIVANLINDDFGGLHHGRMGRNPTVQHALQLAFLAPDWTESNVRTMAKAFRLGKEGAVYRAFWGRVLLKGVGLTVLFNLALSGFDDDDFWERYKKAWKAGNFRWLDVDVTPLYRRLGGKDMTARKYFSVIGHLRDPVKFLVHPIRSAKHKGSVISRIMLEMLVGTDWAGRKFTSWSELMGTDDKGVYKTTRKGHYKKGEPKGGKLKGKVVKWEFGGGGPISYEQVPSFLIHEARSVMPIPVQNGLDFLAGEMDAWDAILKSAGAMVSTYKEEEKPVKAAPVPAPLLKSQP
ncbi:MAG TPA: hypothetical protein VNA25_09315, partial [Phycisphaerae bacterium]|nr:hypothetical protein [Phycisphaerae bacterium]